MAKEKTLSLEEEMEIKYKVFKGDNYDELHAKVKENNFYCPLASEHNSSTKCWCKKFKEMDSEGYCDYNFVYKKARTPEEIEKFTNTSIQWNTKRENEILREEKAKEKAARKAEAKNGW